MRQRLFDDTGVSVSEIGLGAWQLGGAEWGEVSEEDSLLTLRAAVENGINFFDTADVYGLGRSEELIGKFLKDCPEKIFVATKLGCFPKPGWPQNFSLEAFRAHAEASLRRLGVDALDLIQLHNLVDEKEWETALGPHGALEALVEARANGLVRFIGVTGHGTQVAAMHRRSLERFVRLRQAIRIFLFCHDEPHILSKVTKRKLHVIFMFSGDNAQQTGVPWGTCKNTSV